MIPAPELIWAWCREGWKYRSRQRGGWPGLKRFGPEPYAAQVKLEMELIVAQDYCDYFALVSDLVRFAKDAGIPVGPGRGSSAASLVCYLLRITEVDPLLYPLMDFSRFIVPGREDLPDIDVDFDDSRRAEVRAYAVAKYGSARVGNVGTFTRYKGKNSLDDVGRVYQIPKPDLEIVKDLVVERSGGDSRADASLGDTFEMFPAAQAILDKHPSIQMAIELEGNYRSMSVHSAGLVITNTPVSDVCAMYTRDAPKSAGPDAPQLTAVAVDKYSAEYIGLMKVDVLGLLTMGMHSLALQEAGLTLEDLYAIPTDDPRTLAAFKANDVVGIFQFEGRATRLVGRDLKPDSFLELVDVNGLSRPGPLFSGTTAEYIDVKHGRKTMVSIHPVIDEIAAGTKGTIIYQEQILRVLRLFGGLEAKRVHDIRRIISQKLGEAQFNASQEAFIQGAQALHGVDRPVAIEVWSRVVTSASYAFVYAHSLSYALIGFWSMWLKVHHPEAFYAAQLEKVAKEKWPRLIKDAGNHGVDVRGVTPGLSRRSWAVAEVSVKGASGKAVVAGWEQLEGVGPSIATSIEEYAKDHDIQTPSDLLGVSGIGPKTLEKFRHQMDTDDPFGLRRVERALAKVRREIAEGEIPLRLVTNASDAILDVQGGREVIWVGFVKLKEYKDYVEDERARSGRDVEEIKAEMNSPDKVISCVLHCYDDGDEDVYVRVTRFDYPKWKRHLESIVVGRDVIHVVARKSRGGFGASLYVRELAVIEPEV